MDVCFRLIDGSVKCGFWGVAVVLARPWLARLAFPPHAAMLCSDLWGSTGDHMDSKCGFRHRETLSHFTGAWLS